MQRRAKVQKKAKLSFHICYGVVIINLVVILLAENSLSQSDVVDLPDIFLQITAVVLGATIAAYLTTTTYDYISRSTQEREWKRRIKMTTWEKTFLSIYTEVVSHVGTIEYFGYPHSDMFRTFSMSPDETILEIIDPEYLETLTKHIGTFNRYSEANITFNQAVKREIQSYHTKLFPGVDPPFLSRLTYILIDSALYFAGKKSDIPDKDRREYASLFDPLQATSSDPSVDATTAIQGLRYLIRELPETKQFLSLQKKLVKSTERLIDITKTIIQEPYAT